MLPRNRASDGYSRSRCAFQHNRSLWISVRLSGYFGAVSRLPGIQGATYATRWKQVQKYVQHSNVEYCWNAWVLFSTGTIHILHIVSWWHWWDYLGKDIWVQLPFCAILRIQEEYPSQEYGGFHELQGWLSYWASPLALSGPYAPWQTVPYLASPFLLWEWVTPAVGLVCLFCVWCTGQLPLASGHQCTLKVQQFTFLRKHVKVYVNNWK